MVKPLQKLDILITIFNQEEIVERVLHGVFRNTSTPFHLILIFDGCTDRTRERALEYIKKARPALLADLTIEDTPNLFELRANNYGFKLAKTEYLITIQDDMIIREYAWERRLTYPIRKFDDVLGVSARMAQDVAKIGEGVEKYSNQAGRELGNLPRNVFAIRDIGIRGPFAFRVDYLKELGYLNDRYAPGALDDAELSLRAWRDKGWKVGSFWIDYRSRQEWSKVNAPDSTMKAWDSWKRNQVKIYEDFKSYLESGAKHDEDRRIGEHEIDYSKRLGLIERIQWFLRRPRRADRRLWDRRWRETKRKIAVASKRPFIFLIAQVFGNRFREQEKELGIKQAFLKVYREKSQKK